MDILWIYYGYVSGWWFGTWILFSPIVVLMIQSDFHIFQRDWNHQPDIYIYIHMNNMDIIWIIIWIIYYLQLLWIYHLLCNIGMKKTDYVDIWIWIIIYNMICKNRWIYRHPSYSLSIFYSIIWIIWILNRCNLLVLWIYNYYGYYYDILLIYVIYTILTNLLILECDFSDFEVRYMNLMRCHNH